MWQLYSVTEFKLSVENVVAVRSSLFKMNSLRTKLASGNNVLSDDIMFWQS